MKNPFIVGEQIYLRAIEETDIPLQVRWFNDPEVNSHLGAGCYPINLLREQQYVRDLYGDQTSLNLAIIVKDQDRHIGGISLRNLQESHRSVTLGIVIGEKDCWDKGYGAEAIGLIVAHGFLMLNLNRIWLMVLGSNHRAIRAYEKVGFAKEGVLRQNVFLDGGYHDTVVMGLLRHEWQATGDKRAPAGQ